MVDIRHVYVVICGDKRVLVM